MENVISRVNTQPGLSVTNKEILAKYPQLCEIPEGSTHGPCFIGAVGTETVGQDGNPYVPISIYQMRNDLYEGGDNKESNLFFRGWDKLENLVKHTENATPAQIKEQNLQEGFVIPGAQLFVDYQVGEPFWTSRSGEDQEPVLNPKTEMYLAVNGKALYRNVRIQFEENLQHTGIELRRAAKEVDPETMEQIVIDQLNETGTTVITV